MSIYKKLQQVQEKLNAPKSQFNKFGGYNYRNVEDIMAGVKPLLVEFNTTIILSDELVLIGERYYIKATALFIDVDEQKPASLSSTGYARETETKKGMDESQITGCASSYARKYALNGLLAIDDTKDADSQDNTTPKKEVVKAISEEQIKILEDLIKETNTEIEKFCGHFSITRISDLSMANFNRAKKALEDKKGDKQ